MAAKQSQEKALKKLEDQLTCAICLEAFKDPKLLQCFHVYCKECLDRLVVTDQQGQVFIRCPTCRRATVLPPATTVADLQSAFHIHHLFEIQDAFEKVKEPQKVLCGMCKKDARIATSYCRDCGNFICSSCVDSHVQWTSLAKHEVVGLDEFEKRVKQLNALKKVTLYCSLHQSKELELYCETCEELICLLCTVKKHKDHHYDLISDIFEEQKAKIIASLEPVEMQLETLNEAIAENVAESNAVKANKEEVEAEINKKTQELHDMIDARRAELLSKLKVETERKIKKLSIQKDELEMLRIQLTSCAAFVKESLRRGSEGEVMEMKKGVMRQIKGITESYKPEQLPPCEMPNLQFSLPPELSQKCKQFGKIRTMKASPEKSYAIGKSLEVAVCGKKTTAIVHLLDKEGMICPLPAKSITCELTSDTNSDKVKGSVKKIKEGQFEIDYQPTCRGRYKLHIKLEGEHIKGSPFIVAVKLPVKELGEPVRSISGVNKPWGVVVNQRDEVVLVDKGKMCVSSFTSTGEKIQSFGYRGTGHGQISNPLGIAVDCDDGNILVVDYGNHCIQKFSSDGKFIAAVGAQGSGQLQFDHPIGITINSQIKRVYVADQKNHRVQVLQADLSFFSSIGSHGNGPGQLSDPCDVAIDSENNVYVLDHSNNRIQVFTEDGTFLRQIGRSGTVPCELKRPLMIAIDNEDKIYVTESSNRVSVFTKYGVYLTSFGSKRSGLTKQLKDPRGIAVDSLGFVYVCDYGNNRLQIF